MRYLSVSVGSGILFAVMDGLINANPLARRLHRVFEPIARESVSILAGVLIDLAYGFAMAGIFILIHASLPGDSGVVKGLSFALGAWFFRVAMQAASQGMMLRVPARTLLYLLASGLAEMAVLGLLYGLTLRPAP